MASAAKTPPSGFLLVLGSDRDGAEVRWKEGVAWQGCISDWVPPPFRHDAVDAVKSGWIS